MTGSAGGVIRDILCNRVPLILQQDLYGTAAIGGVVVFLILQSIGLKKFSALATGFAVIIFLRFLAIQYGAHLPMIQIPPSS